MKRTILTNTAEIFWTHLIMFLFGVLAGWVFL
jgi:hypothetical protein